MKRSGSFQYVARTGNSGTPIYSPTTNGVYLQNETVSCIGMSRIELCGSLLGNSYATTNVDFTTVNSDYRARFGYGLSAN